MNASNPCLDVTPERPWLGLRSFTEEARDYFYGRDAELADLFERVVHRPLTVLFGQSGLGKTSLLRAALGPRLRERGFTPVFIRLDHSADAPPLERQALRALASVFPANSPDLTGDSPPGLWEYFHDPASGFLRHDSPRPVLIFDQFEEIFTLAASADRRDEAESFRDALASVVENRPPGSLRLRMESDDTLTEHFDFQAQPCKVLLSLREDFLHLLERWRGAMPSLMENRLELNLLNGPQALRAVIEPGRKRPGQPPIVAEETAAAIVRFVAGANPDKPLSSIDAVPPLLSLICAELNAQRFGPDGLPRRPSVESTQLQGKSEDILLHYYEDTFAPHPPAVRCFVEDRLLSADGSFRESVAEATAIRNLTNAGLTKQQADAAISDLVDQRLLVTEERRGTRRIELTHDILTGVARLSRDQRREREDKAKAAMDAEAASERELAQHRQLRRSRQLTTAYAGLALVAGIAFIYGFSKQREANTTLGDIKYKKALIAIKNEVTERENAEHTETLTKYRSLLVKAAISDCLVAENELQAGHVHEALAHLARACEFDPDSTLAREKAVMALYHYPRPKNHSVWYGCDLTNAEFSPNGKYVVTVSADQTAKVWDIATDQEIATLTGHGVTVTSALFSPNGVRIVTISNDQTARVWDAMTGNILVTYEGGVTGVRFSPDGSCIVTASSDQTARVWDASTGKNIATTEGIEGGVMCAQFSLEDKLIVTVSRDQTAQVWDAVTGIKSNTFTWHVKKLMSAEFNSDGTRMVTTADDQTASVWAIPEPIVVVKMVHGESQTVLEWPSSTIKLLMNLTGHRNNLRSAHFSRDGTRIVTASDDNTVRVWNAGTGKCIGTLAGQSGGVLSARFSQDCARIVTASADQTIRVWDVLPSGAGQTPEWFADFLRYMAQRQFNADGELETLKPDGLRVIQASLRAELLNGSSKDKHYLSVLRRWVPE